MNTAAFIATAKTYEGTPFLHQGRLPGVGLDCGGVVVCALRAVGYRVIDVVGYGRLPGKGMLEKIVEENCDKIEPGDLQDGDILIFRFAREPQHVAIHAGGQLIHAWQDIGRVVVHDFDAVWRRRLTGCYRVRG